MSTVRVSLSDELKEYVDEAASRGKCSASAYIRSLIEADHERRESNPTGPPGYGGFAFDWQELRDRIHARSDSSGWRHD